MLHPAPTSKIAQHLARGTVAEHIAATATRPAFIVVTVSNTSYKLHLEPTCPIDTPVGKRVVGTIQAQARRVDVVTTGGRFIDPVFGRPRRVQGVVVRADAGSNTLIVHAGVPMICSLTDARQNAGEFSEGDFVSFDILRGATFTPER